MRTNASLIYYRSRDSSEDSSLNLCNKDIKELLNIGDNKLDTNAKICGIKYFKYFKLVDDLQSTFSFSLKTTYPGLVIGIGYNHPPSKKSDFQLGFYFDHTTGMPVIPGSTVKGVLKSVFPKIEISRNDSEEIKIEKQKLNNEKLSYVNNILQEKLGKEPFLTQDNWEILFGKGNIFYDAYISNVPDDGKIFAEDYITPHTAGPFKDPIPIRFLKIAPGVTFTFQFKFVESKFNNIKIVPSDKLKLFEQILLDFGIGAKRNVGYGNLVEVAKLNKEN